MPRISMFAKYLLGAAAVLCACPHLAAAAKITTFDPPGSEDTFAYSISRAGIAGYY